jgi:hypothetical protein
MSRYVIDCRVTPSENNCSLTISGSKDEVLTAATAHAVSAHGHTDGTELHEALRTALVEEATV